jgi:multicomponent Na+:H+ antiporter subunit B
MTLQVRRALFLVSIAVVLVVLVAGLAGLPDFGHYPGPYGNVLNLLAVPQRHATNVVTAVNFDYRAVDTMGEEFILFAAVLGVALLLRDEAAAARAERNTRRFPSDAVRLVGVPMIGGGLLVGLWLAAFGYVTPGGGFQGGVVVAGGVLLLYVIGSHRDYHPFRDEHVLDPLEGLGAGGYVVIGLAALVSGTAFLANLFGHGKTGTLLSGGSIPVLNWASAIAVTAAMLLLFAEFLETYVVPLEPEDAAE